jgi:hypothetical protein
VTEEQWEKIEKILLREGMDPATVRERLERIASDNSTPEQRIKECDNRLLWCGDFLKRLPRLRMMEEAALIAIFESQLQADKQIRSICVELIRANAPPIFVRECNILSLWLARGGRLTKYGKGPHADFYAAAYEAVFQKDAPGPSRIKETIRDFLRLKLVVLSGTGTMSVHADVVRPKAEKPATI